MERETMTNTAPEHNRKINHRARPHGEPDLRADPRVADPEARQRSTSYESEPPRDRGLVVTLWLLALLLAESEFWILAFAHMYPR
jgi:hypothetical protein